MIDDEYMTYWRSRAISAEMKVIKFRNKLQFWKTAAIGFAVVVIILTFI